MTSGGQFAAGCALAVVLLGAVPAATAPRGKANVSFDVRDVDALPAGGVTGKIVAAGGATWELVSDADGAATATLAAGDYAVVWYYGGVSVATSAFHVAADRSAQQVRAVVPLYRFAYQVHANNGDPLVGARADLRGADGMTWALPLRGGRIAGLAPAGVVIGTLTWQGAQVALDELQIPAARQATVRVDMEELTVRLTQAGTGIGFGPARVRLAAPGVSDADAVEAWTDSSGVLRVLRPRGDVAVQVRWFGEHLQGQGTAPGVVDLALPVATRTLPLPESLQKSGGWLRLKQPGFEIWVEAPAAAVRLPLAPGGYDVVAHDAARHPRATGVLRVEGSATTARIDWAPIAGDVADSVRERNLVWAGRSLKEAPSAALEAGTAWRELSVATDGRLGLLPAGLHLRVPAHALGLVYSTDTEQIPVQLGVLDVHPPQAGRIKVIDPLRPNAAHVQACVPAGCRVLVPPGSYWIWAPGAQLMQQPAQVDDGQSVRVTLSALEAVR